MPYITAVIGLLNADGSNPVPAKPDGTRESPVIQLGAGLTFTGDVRGRVVMNATSGFIGEISDAQHGNRGGGTLHAEASGGAAGFLSVALWTLLTGATEEPISLALARRGSGGELGAAWFFVGSAASAASSGSIRLPDGGTIMAAPFGGAGPARTLIRAGSPNECQIGGFDTNDTTVRIGVKASGSIVATVGASDVLTIDATAVELAVFDVMFTDGGAVTFSQDPSTGSGATAPTWSMTAPAATGGGGSTGGALVLGTGTGDTPGGFTVKVGSNPIVLASSAQIVLATYGGAALISHNTGTDTSTVTDGVATVNHSATTRWFLQFTSGTATPVIDTISTAGKPNAALFGSAVSVGEGVLLWTSASTIPGANPPANSFYLYVDPADGILKARGSAGTITALAVP